MGILAKNGVVMASEKKITSGLLAQARVSGPARSILIVIVPTENSQRLTNMLLCIIVLPANFYHILRSYQKQ